MLQQHDMLQLHNVLRPKTDTNVSLSTERDSTNWGIQNRNSLFEVSDKLNEDKKEKNQKINSTSQGLPEEAEHWLKKKKKKCSRYSTITPEGREIRYYKDGKLKMVLINTEELSQIIFMNDKWSDKLLKKIRKAQEKEEERKMKEKFQEEQSMTEQISENKKENIIPVEEAAEISQPEITAKQEEEVETEVEQKLEPSEKERKTEVEKKEVEDQTYEQEKNVEKITEEKVEEKSEEKKEAKQMLKHRWKKTEKKEISKPGNLRNADKLSEIDPNLQKKKEAVSEFIFIVRGGRKRGRKNCILKMKIKKRKKRKKFWKRKKKGNRKDEEAKTERYLFGRDRAVPIAARNDCSLKEWWWASFQRGEMW